MSIDASQALDVMIGWWWKIVPQIVPQIVPVKVKYFQTVPNETKNSLKN
jgi:hypothetical protein